MGLLKVLPVLLVCIHGSYAVWTLRKMGTQFIPSDYINNNQGEFVYDGGAANSVAFDPAGSYAYVGGDRFVQVVDFTRFRRPYIVRKQKVAAPVNDVAHCGYIVAWVTQGAKITDPGTLHVWDSYRRVSKRWNELCTGTVGSNPVSIKFFNNCKTIVVANKGTAASDPATNQFTDPEGTISIVRITNQQQQQQNFPNQGAGRNRVTQGTCPGQTGSRMTITTLDFNFNGRAGPQIFQGLRYPFMYANATGGRRTQTFAQAMEPTYVTHDMTYNNTAYVSLRENNAVVMVNIGPGQEAITGISPMGLKYWNNYNLDATVSNPPKESFRKYPIYSFRQPNAIEPFENTYMTRSWNGQNAWEVKESFIFTADEGATTSYPGVQFTDAVPASQLINAPQWTRDPSIAQLEVSRFAGLNNPYNPNSGHQYVSFFGGRGISMYKYNESSRVLDLFWDSGDQIAQAVSQFYPQVFNSKSSTPDSQSYGPVSQRDMASTKLGSQCKSLAIGLPRRDTTLLFVGVDGSSVIGIYSMPNNGSFSYPQFESVYRQAPKQKRFKDLMMNKKAGDIDPAKLVFISPRDTPDAKPYLMVMGKKSGTLSIYQIFQEPRDNMLNRLRKEARASATALSHSLPAILMSFIVAAIGRFL